MTIKKRLFCSNILMIVVPAAIVAFVGLLCMALLWVTLQSEGSMWLEDGEDLTHIGRKITNQIVCLFQPQYTADRSVLPVVMSEQQERGNI